MDRRGGSRLDHRGGAVRRRAPAGQLQMQVRSQARMLDVREPLEPVLEQLDGGAGVVLRRGRDDSRQVTEAAGELPEQNVELTAAALVGGCGEALVGPLSPVAGQPPSSEEVVDALRTFVRRAVGAE